MSLFDRLKSRHNISKNYPWWVWVIGLPLGIIVIPVGVMLFDLIPTLIIAMLIAVFETIIQSPVCLMMIIVLVIIAWVVRNNAKLYDYTEICILLCIFIVVEYATWKHKVWIEPFLWFDQSLINIAFSIIWQIVIGLAILAWINKFRKDAEECKCMQVDDGDVLKSSNELELLFKSTSKVFHSDMAIDDKQCQLRNRFMSDANDAYNRGDIETLRQLLQEWENQH